MNLALTKYTTANQLQDCTYDLIFVLEWYFLHPEVRRQPAESCLHCDDPHGVTPRKFESMLDKKQSAICCRCGFCIVLECHSEMECQTFTGMKPSKASAYVSGLSVRVFERHHSGGGAETIATACHSRLKCFKLNF
jgi:hypothetical protein